MCKYNQPIDQPFFVYITITSLLTSLLASQKEPQGTSQEGGGIRTTGEAHQHSKRKVADGFAAKEENGNNSEQGGAHSVNAAAHGLPDAVINHLAQGFATTMNLEVFANAVKNNDGAVDGIAYYGEQRCNEGGIHFHLEQGEIAECYGDVNNQGDDGSHSKLKLKAQGDISNHQEPGEHLSLIHI